MNLTEFASEVVPKIEETLATELKQSTTEKTLRDAMTYAVMAGGKRLRPLLTLAVAQSYGMGVPGLVRAASALELIHTYSLIHDDLPAMDNDDMRRGKPTTHRQFGEDVAILAGDALQPLAYQWLASAPLLTTPQKAELTLQLALASGANGMVAGQVMDMAATNADTITLDQAKAIHYRKTSALIAYAAIAGGIMAHASEAVKEQLWNFGMAYGLAFQIKDDLDDLGQDDDEDKQAYPTLLGVQGAVDALREQVDLANQALQKFGELTGNDITLLVSFLDYFNETLEK
ncbi:polyprenyl synthetase family protein [Weissella confusa]|uniref:polyprenyl synthetase family protein n=1 Tax=Weissella confusa TaxID=1583 RepID=UPI0010819172|nr:farnesyl diphosphate synthase [Weissella confusa]MBJ7628863.1 polyprenyl synthetase family protein [Weissella confusa]TGE49568.1 polyprenyl synthetase family protein [Weissella confusa]